jgi:hypothetical protein
LLFHNHGLNPGDIGATCSFGAGYSVGGLVLGKIQQIPEKQSEIHSHDSQKPDDPKKSNSLYF